MQYKKKFADNCVHYERNEGDQKGREILRHGIDKPCPLESPLPAPKAQQATQLPPSLPEVMRRNRAIAWSCVSQLYAGGGIDIEVAKVLVRKIEADLDVVVDHA